MIILDSTTKSLELVLGGAITTNQLPFVASYVDITTTTYTPISSDGQSNNSTPVTIVSSPLASTQRQIKLVTIKNEDTVDAIVTLRYNDNSTIRKIVTITLASGSTLIYTDGEGFRVIDSTGNILTSGSGGGGTPGGSNTQVQFNDSGSFGGDAGLTFIKATGLLSSTLLKGTELQLTDSDASNLLRIIEGSNLSADRLLTLLTGDAARTITLSGNPTLSDWFDQSVKVASTPTFGATTITGLLDISGASAGQIKFPATQNASSNANTLDDYEEGTFTPTLTADTVTVAPSYSSRAGIYLKIGKTIYVSVSIFLSNRGTLSGNLYIGGLPFTTLNGDPLSVGVITFANFNTGYCFVDGVPLQNDTRALLLGSQGGAVTSLGNVGFGDLTNTSIFRFTCIYGAAS